MSRLISSCEIDIEVVFNDIFPYSGIIDGRRRYRFFELMAQSGSQLLVERASSGTQVLQRASAVLRLVSSHNRTGVRLVDLMALIPLERSTMHRILQSLVSDGLLAQDQSTKRYVLGPFAYELGIAASTRVDLGRVSQKPLQEVANLTGDTAFLIIRAGMDGLCIDRREGGYPVKAFVLTPGQRRPLGVGAGSVALLSALPDREVRDVIAANAARYEEPPHPVTARSVWKAVVTTRENGFSLHDIREIKGLRAIAIPIAGEHGDVYGAVSVSALSMRLRGRHLAEALAAIKSAVASLGHEFDSYKLSNPDPLKARRK